MAQSAKAKVFMTGRSQAVRIPAEFRFTTKEVYIRRDPASGDIVLSKAPSSLKEIFAAIDAANPDRDFLLERNQGDQPDRVEL